MARTRPAVDVAAPSRPREPHPIARRSPELVARLRASSRRDLVSLAARSGPRAEAQRLPDLGIAPERLGVSADAVGARSELALAPLTANRVALCTLRKASS